MLKCAASQRKGGKEAREEKPGEPEERVARKQGKNITSSNQQAEALNKQLYCWFGKGNFGKEKVRFVIRS